MSARHERRRRMLVDDLPSSDSDEMRIRLADDDGRSEPNGRRLYAALDGDGRQRAIHDLVPSRWLSIGLALAACLTVVAALELLHVWARSLGGLFSPQELAALDIRSPQSISRWFAATVLSAAGLVAIFIFSLRRRRLDDYHGRYRLWIWAALGCAWGSLAETAGTGALANALCSRAASACGIAPAVVWPAILVTVLGVLGTRMLIEVWRYRPAVAALGLMTVALITGKIAGWNWLALEQDLAGPLVERGGRLLGCVLLLATLLVYSRHVMREIAGLVPIAAPKRRRKKIKPAAAEKPRILDEAPAAEPAVERRAIEPVRSLREAVVSRLSDDDDDEDDYSSERVGSADRNRALSRSERKRLRREARKAS